MRRSDSWRLAVLALAVLAPSVCADGRRTGSLLIFPVHHSGPSLLTVVSVTNTNLQPMTPMSFGGSTMLHFQYVNTVQDPARPTVPLGRTVFDRYEFLTPGDTFSVRTSCHNAYAGSGQSGFLVVSAQNPSLFNTAWDFDWLVGSELVVSPAGGLYALNAVPFRGIPGPGLATDLDGDGRLDLDGLEYEGVPDKLFVDSFMAMGGSRLALLSLTGGSGTTSVLAIDVWNDAGYALSTTLTMGCWFDQPLVSLSPLFDSDFLTGATPHDPAEMDLNCLGHGGVEMGWARIESVGVFLAGGLQVATDGALLGCITSGVTPWSNGGHLCWELYATQHNGSVLEP